MVISRKCGKCQRTHKVSELAHLRWPAYSTLDPATSRPERRLFNGHAESADRAARRLRLFRPIGAAFATLRASAQTITRVVLIGPAHYVHLNGIAVPSVNAFATPLGRVPVDIEACGEISRLKLLPRQDYFLETGAILVGAQGLEPWTRSLVSCSRSSNTWMRPPSSGGRPLSQPFEPYMREGI